MISNDQYEKQAKYAEDAAKKLNDMGPLGEHEHIHESDGLMYMSHPPQMKCKICGQFYR